MRLLRKLSPVMMLALFGALCMVRADWPTYRHDAARSGYTGEELPTELKLLWRYEAQHPPRPAWPRSREDDVRPGEPSDRGGRDCVFGR